MEQFISLLTRLYLSAIGFLVAVVVALKLIAELSQYLVWLMVLVLLFIAARLVWARTRW